VAARKGSADGLSPPAIVEPVKRRTPLAFARNAVRTTINGSSSKSCDEKGVSTGLTTEKIKLSSLGDLELTLSCPTCLRSHKWKLKDAWIAGQERPKY